MNTLFLGSSSFTGFHFINKLAKKKKIKFFVYLPKKKANINL